MHLWYAGSFGGALQGALWHHSVWIAYTLSLSLCAWTCVGRTGRNRYRVILPQRWRCWALRR